MQGLNPSGPAVALQHDTTGRHRPRNAVPIGQIRAVAPQPATAALSRFLSAPRRQGRTRWSYPSGTVLSQLRPAITAGSMLTEVGLLALGWPRPWGHNQRPAATHLSTAAPVPIPPWTSQSSTASRPVARGNGDHQGAPLPPTQQRTKAPRTRASEQGGTSLAPRRCAGVHRDRRSRVHARRPTQPSTVSQRPARCPLRQQPERACDTSRHAPAPLSPVPATLLGRCSTAATGRRACGTSKATIAPHSQQSPTATAIGCDGWLCRPALSRCARAVTRTWRDRCNGAVHDDTRPHEQV